MEWVGVDDGEDLCGGEEGVGVVGSVGGGWERWGGVWGVEGCGVVEGVGGGGVEDGGVVWVVFWGYGEVVVLVYVDYVGVGFG